METQTLVKEICPTTTQEWVKRGALLVDVREKDEVAELAYDVHNIVNIPLSEFEDHYTELPTLVCKREINIVILQLINEAWGRQKQTCLLKSKTSWQIWLKQ